MTPIYGEVGVACMNLLTLGKCKKRCYHLLKGKGCWCFVLDILVSIILLSHKVSLKIALVNFTASTKCLSFYMVKYKKKRFFRGKKGNWKTVP